MFQQENFSVNPPWGCKAQPRYASLRYPFCNTAANMHPVLTLRLAEFAIERT